MILWYLLISVLYCATFIAFMKTKEDEKPYWDGYGDWQIQYLVLCIVGTALWPLIIPFIIFYKLAYKILNKNK